MITLPSRPTRRVPREETELTAMLCGGGRNNFMQGASSEGCVQLCLVNHYIKCPGSCPLSLLLVTSPNGQVR